MNENNDVAEALRPVARAFERLGVRYYVGGSVASAFHGAMRTTMDVDVIADLDDSHVAGLLADLSDGFYASEAAIRDAIRRRSSFNLIHLQTSFKVDVFMSRNRPFDESALVRATAGQLGSGSGFFVPIASA